MGCRRRVVYDPDQRDSEATLNQALIKTNRQPAGRPQTRDKDALEGVEKIPIEMTWPPWGLNTRPPALKPARCWHICRRSTE
jgi:hypothetical protein